MPAIGSPRSSSTRPLITLIRGNAKSTFSATSFSAISSGRPARRDDAGRSSARDSHCARHAACSGREECRGTRNVRRSTCSRSAACPGTRSRTRANLRPPEGLACVQARDAAADDISSVRRTCARLSGFPVSRLVMRPRMTPPLLTSCAGSRGAASRGTGTALCGAAGATSAEIARARITAAASMRTLPFRER